MVLGSKDKYSEDRNIYINLVKRDETDTLKNILFSLEFFFFFCKIAPRKKNNTIQNLFKEIIYPLSHQLLKICGRYDTGDKKMIAIIHNFSVLYIYIYIGVVS